MRLTLIRLHLLNQIISPKENKNLSIMSFKQTDLLKIWPFCCYSVQQFIMQSKLILLYMNERVSKKVLISPLGPKSKVTEGSLYAVPSFLVNISSGQRNILFSFQLDSLYTRQICWEETALDVPRECREAFSAALFLFTTLTPTSVLC